MDYLRGKNKLDANNQEDIEIQIVGWHNYDDHELDEEMMGEDNEFNVLITGIDSLKRSVAVYVEGFKPFFFIPSGPVIMVCNPSWPASSFLILKLYKYSGARFYNSLRF